MLFRSALARRVAVKLLSVGAIVLSLALVFGGPVWAREPAPQSLTEFDVALHDLPKTAQETYGLVLSGGPFPYDKDGSVFGNRERLLPRQSRGFYREYTVRTPGRRDRGAQRIVCGGFRPQAPEVCYYTKDHYASFRRIAP